MEQKPTNVNANARSSLPNERKDNEIDLLELFMKLWDHIHEILMCMLVGAVIVNAYSYFFIHPTYQSTAKLYVVSASKDSVVDLTDLNIGTSLTADYEELILSYPVLETVIDDLSLDETYGYTDKELSSMISISNPSDTRVLYITVTAEEPKLAMDIANSMTDAVVDYLPETMSTNPPNIVQRARMPETKAGPSYTKYTAIGLLLGLVLSVIFFTVQFCLDDTIRTAEELEKYFDVVPLTTIPKSDALAEADGEEKPKKKLWGRKKK